MNPLLVSIEKLLSANVGVAYSAASLSFGKGAIPSTIVVGNAHEATWFDLASLTKPLSTALLTMRLCDQNKVQLNESVLPDATLVHLLSHTAGFPACFPPLWAEKQGLLQRPSDLSRKAVLQSAAQADREAVGRRSVYSDLGYIVLGDLLEHRGQARLDEQLSQLLAPLELSLGFRPLDRVASDVPKPQDIAPTRRETPHREELVGVVHDDTARAMLGVAGHAGLFGTSTAVYRLANALLHRYHDEKPTPKHLCLRSQTVRRFFRLPAQPGLPGTFGLGFDHPDPIRPGEPCLSSAGTLWPRDGVGHLGFTGCSFWLDPKARLCAVLVSNRVCAKTTIEAEQRKAALRVLRPALHDAIVRWAS
jgi:CubicO group peptidase (beta-lactamase class C family)